MCASLFLLCFTKRNYWDVSNRTMSAFKDYCNNYYLIYYSLLMESGYEICQLLPIKLTTIWEKEVRFFFDRW
jgi:hypothetical protein